MLSVSKCKIAFLIFLFGGSFIVSSFNDPIFRDVKYIDGFKNKKICRNFIKNFRKNLFSEKEKSLMVFLMSDFDSRDVTNYNIYLDFFSFSNYFSKVDSDFLENWLQSLSTCVTTLSNDDLENILLTSNNVVKNSIISEKKDFSWSFVGSFSSLKEDTLVFHFELDSLILSNEFNEIVINNAVGAFDLRKNKFYGISGEADWSRFGLDSEKLKVYLSEYEIDFYKRKYEVENAHLISSLHFNLESIGYFSDRLSKFGRIEKYPKFKSIIDDLKIDFFNGFSLVAAVNIENETFYFNKFHTPLEFSFENNYINGVFSSDLLKFKKDSFFSEKVKSKFYFNGIDSLYHPEMKFRYNDVEKNIYLRRYDKTYLSFKPIFNSFHGLNIYSDFFRINLENNTAAFVHVPDQINQKVIFESVDYYDDNRFYDLNLDEGGNLLSILMHFSNEFGEKDNIPLNDFKKSLKLKNSRFSDIIKTLEIFDFIEVNTIKNTFDIKNRAFSFFDSRHRKFDYDSFQIESSCLLNDTVSKMNFKNLEMDILNVLDLKLTSQHKYNIQLNNKTITFFDNKSFMMNADLYFGNFSFLSDKIEFDYENFCLNFPEKSTLNIFNFKLPNQQKLIQKIFFKGGKIQLDSVSNKSGLVTTFDFPKFHLTDSNFVHFSDSKIKLILEKKTIPFLDEIAIQNLSFEGGMVMENGFDFLKGDVFLDIVNGFKCFGVAKNKNIFNQSTFSGNFCFDNRGFLITKGVVLNPNFSFSGDSIFLNSNYLYSDSIILETFNPKIESFVASVYYNPLDSVSFYSPKTPFFYEDKWRFFGELNYDFSSCNIFASGKLVSSLFEINSDYFSFNKNSFMAGNAEISLFEGDVNKFLGKGVSVEFLKNKNTLSMIKGDINFSLPKIKNDVNFEMAILDLNQKKINFLNLNEEDNSVVILKDNFECILKEFLYDLNSDRSRLFWFRPLVFNKYIITPNNHFLELNNNGFLDVFLAKKVIRKKSGKDIELSNKLISFDKEMKTFFIQ